MNEPATQFADRTGRPRSRRRLLVVIVLFAVVIVAGIGSDRTAADARSGERFEGLASSSAPVAAPRDTPNRLRLATFNIHSGESADGAAAWDRAVETLRGFDFVGLQEVRGSLFGSGQAERLGETLGMPWCFAPSEQRYWHGHFGNAALSTLPVHKWESVPLTNTRGKAYRNYLQTEVEFAGRTVTVIVTHIDRRDDRTSQLAHIGELFLALPTPVVLMGDLNSTGDQPGLRRMLDAPGVVDAHADKVDPLGRIDWILLRGLSVVDAGVVDLGASDHPCLWVEVEGGFPE